MRRKRYAVLALMLLNSSFIFADESLFSTRVVGGSDATEGNQDWIVYVQAGNFLCGGSLIDADTIMTAAHCLHDANNNPIDASDVTVTVGEYNTRDSSPASATISTIYIHEDYNPTTDVSSNDIALMRLTSSATNITPIDRANSTTTTAAVAGGDAVTILGWGSTIAQTAGETATTQLADILQEASVPLRTDAQCASSYGSTYVSSTMVCAGENTGGIDSCQGDSGGPLILNNEQVGIVSFGSGCAQAGFPGVYVRVATYASWIDNFLSGITFNNSLEFAFSAVNGTETLNLIINNNSDDIANISFTLSGDSAFTFNASDCATIAANTSCTLAITYTPANATSSEAIFSISSDLPNTSTISTTFSISSLFSTSSSSSSGGGSLFFILLGIPLLWIRRRVH